MNRIIVYDEPGIRFCEPLLNNWERSGIELKRQLTEAGLDVFAEHEAQGDVEKDIGIYFDALLRHRHPVIHKKSLYISLEPPVINRRFYERISGWPYTRILTFSREHVDDKHVFYSPYPAVRYTFREFVIATETFNPPKIEYTTPEKDKGMVAITANKVSDHPGELYTARRKIYRAMGKKLHLYGNGWRDDPICNFVDYRGTCKHNFDTYCEYKYAISIENMYLDGYASEKYWTPLQAGCELIRIGWKPDYSLDDCDEKGWAKRIVEHVKAIA